MEPITNPLETFAPSLLPPAMGERCVACGSLLGRDQRYCLECGERNGEPRLARMTGRPAVPEAVVAPPPRARRPRASASTTLVAGVGVLVLALGVGVEIGRSSGDNQKAATTPPVRLVMPTGAVGTGTAAVTATSTPGAGGTTTAEGGGKAGGSGKGGKGGGGEGGGKATPTPTPGASATPPPTVKVGQKGHGAGYKNGKFTGDFFGG
jgi:hypothetical protein